MSMRKMDLKKKSEEVKLFVYSCGIGHNAEIANLDFSAFDMVYASKALLSEYLGNFAKSESSAPVLCTIGAHARQDAKNILKFAQNGKKILVLCSGDALYHAFGGTLLDCAKEENLSNFLSEHSVFYPNITAFQSLFHQIGLAWSEATLFSAHNYSSLPLRKILSNPMPLIYGGTRFPAHIIAQEIIDFNPDFANQCAIAAEYLGSSYSEKAQRIVEANLEDIAKENFAPTSLLLLPYHIDMMKKIHLSLGLEESFYHKEENLITASDARAIILSRLKLPLKGILWDLGAGSGSIGLEAAALLPNLEVYAIEKNGKRILDIEANKKKMGVDNYTVIHSAIQEKLQEDDLQKADRIFIGGGGKEIVEIVKLAKQKLNENGVMVISAVTLETFSALHSWKKEEENVQCIKLDIAKERIIAKEYSSFSQNNTLYIFIYQA